MHDSTIRTPTPTPTVDRILTGHERRRLERCWRPAGTEAWLVIHTRSGHATIGPPRTELVVGPGDAVLFAPGAPQAFGGVDPGRPWEILWAHFEPLPHWLDLLRWPEPVRGVGHLTVSNPRALGRIEGLLLEADRLATSGLPQAALLARNALEAAFLWWNLRDPTGRPLDSRVVEAIDHISRTGGRLSVEQLARTVHLSPSRFAELFRRETGLPPRRFVERQRLERAKQLLEATSLPVNAIAIQVGFSSQFYFATRFRRATGLTPTAYRASRWARTRPEE